MMAKLYEILTAQPGAGIEGMPEDEIVTWMSPGLAYNKEDFLFAVRGIGGGESRVLGEAGIDAPREPTAEAGAEAEGGAEEGAMVNEPGTISAGDDVRRRLLAASNWARIANFVPDVEDVFDDDSQRKMFDTTAFSQDGLSIASIYENVLRFSEVAAMEITEEQEKNLERFRSLLTETREENDLFTGETREIIDDSRLVKAYNTYQQEYVDAMLLYNTKRLNALNSDDAAAVQDWALNAELYKQKVKSAYGKWISAGYKNQVEAMHGYINQVTQRNLVLMKEDLLEKLRMSELTDPTTGPFYWTSVAPARFAFADSWGNYSFSHTEVESYRKKSYRKYEGGGGANFGGFSVWGGGSSESQRYESDFDLSDFKMDFEFTQTFIMRPWYGPEFLLGNAWRFGDNMPNLTNMTESLSDGESPPTGSLTAIPTAALFVRNVTINFKELERDYDRFVKDVKAKGGLRIGGIGLIRGGHTRSDQQSKYHYEKTEEGLHVPGMQLVGFKCKLLPELPNPSDEVEKWA